jgi:hypothetical protein
VEDVEEEGGVVEEKRENREEVVVEEKRKEESSGVVENQLTRVSVKQAIMNPLSYAKTTILITGTIAYSSAELQRIDVASDGGKLICDLGHAVGVEWSGLEGGVVVEVRGVVKKKARRTYMDVESVRFVVR